MHAVMKLQSDAHRVKPVLIAGVLILMCLHVHLDVCVCVVPWACLCSPVSDCRVLMLYSNRVPVGYMPFLDRLDLRYTFPRIH